MLIYIICLRLHMFCIAFTLNISERFVRNHFYSFISGHKLSTKYLSCIFVEERSFRNPIIPQILLNYTA